MVADYLIKNRTTLRQMAKDLGIPRSTLHSDLSARLNDIDSIKYKEVVKIFAENLDRGRRKGGEAAARKLHLKYKQRGDTQ